MQYDTKVTVRLKKIEGQLKGIFTYDGRRKRL